MSSAELDSPAPPQPKRLRGRPRKDGLPPIQRKPPSTEPRRPRKDKKPPQPKRLPGRPRKDGLPPIQRKAIAAIEGEQAVEAAQKDAALVARIRYLAGRRQTPDDIAALVLDEFRVRLPPEALKPGGLYYDDFRIGRAKVNLAVGETLVEKATTGKYVETMFWAKSEMGMAETAAGRAKVAQEKGDDFQGIDVGFDDEPAPTPISRGRKAARS